MAAPEPLFYYAIEGQDVAGPFDLVQMAGLLREGVIAPETLTYRDGEADWMPFLERPQYTIAREIPAGAISHRIVAQANQASKAIVPLPSKATLFKLVQALLVLAILGTVGFFFGAGDKLVGTLMLLIGGAISAVAQCLIIVQVIDDGWITVALVALVPGMDIYYFVSNLDKYLAYFWVKYAGAAIAVGAALGLAYTAAATGDYDNSLLDLFNVFYHMI